MPDRCESCMFSLKIFVMCAALSAIIFLCCLFYYLIPQEVRDKEVITLQKTMAVVVDAGHGGRDGGASDDAGTLEKDLNLSVSCTLKSILKLCDINVVMTRESDKLVCDENDPALKGKIKMTDLSNRLKIAEENPNSLFISIHMNKFSVEKYKGLQVYYSPNNNSSFELAKSIQERAVAVLQPDNTRMVKKAGSSIFLLDRIASPAVLVECGFLSNNEEAGRLRNPVYRSQLALVIADSVLTNVGLIGNN